MKTINFLSITLFIALIISSCRKIESLPPKPTIEYKSFLIFDTTDMLGNKEKAGRLKFSFKDGDGDIGMEEPTDGQTDTSNLFLTLYRKRSGQMLPDSLKPSYRIPFIENNGQNKILKGTISVTFFYLFDTITDTIRYDFFIKDRALHESNTVSTNEIIIRKNGIY
jgi:hypothetical protein